MKTSLQSLAATLTIVVFLLLGAYYAEAHEGHDHGVTATTTTSAAVNTPVGSATGELNFGAAKPPVAKPTPEPAQKPVPATPSKVESTKVSAAPTTTASSSESQPVQATTTTMVEVSFFARVAGWFSKLWSTVFTF